MKKIKIIGRMLPLLLAVACLSSCDDNSINDVPPIDYKMEVSASVEEIVLTDDNLGNTLVTFNWTPARELPADKYTITYTTFLDIVGNNFGTSTAITTVEESGVFSKSYTGEQINNWAREKWGVPDNTLYTLQFRVLAEWEGPFEAPEVKQVAVAVVPPNYTELEFEADYMYISGSAPGAMLEMTKTIENENQFAWLGNLNAGDLQIVVEYEGKNNYFVPDGGNGTLQDGQPEAIRVAEEGVSWKIETPGEYRIVVNMETARITIYSPATALEPKVVKWIQNSDPQVEVETTVTELWFYGGGTSWGWWKGNLTTSLADPQVLIYQGNALSSGDGVKFTVYGDADFRNVSYAFTNPLTEDGLRQNLQLATRVVGSLHGGYDGETRNSYYRLPSGTNFIVFDLRNMTIYSEIR